MTAIGIVGAGAWGSALAAVARRAGADVMVWARQAKIAQALASGAGNPVYLPGVAFPAGIDASDSIARVAGAADLLLLVVPAQFLRPVAAEAGRHLAPGVPVVLCTKGIERGTNALMTEVAAETLGADRPLAVLSGPTFASEVARDLPTAITLACADGEVGERLVRAIGTRRFRPYLSDDPVGAEVGGAVKNVLAIACGIVAGRAMGDNARAALITRGLAEMSRLAVALGGRMETMMGLAGLGDLVLTAGAMQSRNFSLGAELGAGRPLADILGERHDVTEGVATAASLTARAAAAGVEMPICRAVCAILHEDADIETAVEALLARPFRSERATLR